MDIGFQPHTITCLASGHSSGSTSGEMPWVAPVPCIPAVAQIVRSSCDAPRTLNIRALITSPWISPWVPA